MAVVTLKVALLQQATVKPANIIAYKFRAHILIFLTSSSVSRTAGKDDFFEILFIERVL